MKIRSALKKFCEHCYVVKRGKKVLIKCKVDPRHKQRQGFCSIQGVTSQEQENMQCCSENMMSMDQIYIMSKIQNDCMMPFSISEFQNKINK